MREELVQIEEPGLSIPEHFPKRLHPACLKCLRENVVKQDVVHEETGEVIHRKGDFIIDCNGIPLDYKEEIMRGLPEDVVASMASSMELLATLSDPVKWAEDHLFTFDAEMGTTSKWKPQGATKENILRYNMKEEAANYQEIMVRCSARRMCLRLGRRSGKTWTMMAKVLHKMVTQRNLRVIVVTPFVPQIDLIFDVLNNFIRTSPILKDMDPRFVKSPLRTLELKNGSSAVGFVCNSEAIRGQKADIVIVDEADYLLSDDMSAIMMLLTEHKNTEFYVSSTPTGAQEQFWRWDHDPAYRSFHFPSMCRPTWTTRMEMDMRKENPGLKYVHEALAEYGELNSGVLQNRDIEIALENGNYSYDSTQREDRWVYSIGVDWNPESGTEIVVVGANLLDGEPKYKVVDIGSIIREGNTQLYAINEIRRLNAKWRPFSILVDKGAGSVQEEVLNAIGHSAEFGTADKALATIVESINFGSKIIIYHPVTREEISVFAKPAIVDNAVRMFEAKSVQLSGQDPELLRQLRGYIIKKISEGGRIVYGTVSDAVKDHRLDAFFLGLFAFTKKFSAFGSVDTMNEILTIRAVFDGETIVMNPVVEKPRAELDSQAKTKEELIKERRKEMEKELRANFIPSEDVSAMRYNESHMYQNHLGKIATGRADSLRAVTGRTSRRYLNGN